MRKHSVAFNAPSDDEVGRWLSRVAADNLGRARWRSSFELLTEAHVGCANADVIYVHGVASTRLEGRLLNIVYAGACVHDVLTIVLGHGARYVGVFRLG